MPLSLEVTFAAYLAVLLGTFVPVTFLIVLYSQVSLPPTLLQLIS
jgi:photosystem II reaction center protein PsbM